MQVIVVAVSLLQPGRPQISQTTCLQIQSVNVNVIQWGSSNTHFYTSPGTTRVLTHTFNYGYSFSSPPNLVMATNYMDIEMNDLSYLAIVTTALSSGQITYTAYPRTYLFSYHNQIMAYIRPEMQSNTVQLITDNVKVFPYRYTYAATFSQPKTSTSYFAFCWFNYYDSTNNNVNPYFGIETITKRLTGFDILIQGKSDSGSVMQLHKLGISWLMADNAKLVPNFQKFEWFSKTLTNQNAQVTWTPTITNPLRTGSIVFGLTLISMRINSVIREYIFYDLVSLSSVTAQTWAGSVQLEVRIAFFYCSRSSCAAPKLLDAAANTCVTSCPTGMFPTAYLCALCHLSCVTCTADTSSSCSSCSTSAFRTWAANTCPCSPRHFDTGAASCTACHYSCEDCSAAGATSCSRCHSAEHRTLTNGNTCPCDSGFYSSGGPVCPPCDISCSFCTSGGVSGCSSCADDRSLAAGVCTCLPGTYDDGSNAACANCHYSCRTCLASAGNCQACPAGRTLAAAACPCPSGAFDAGEPTCEACAATCLACSGTPGHCLSCRPADNRLLAGNACLCRSAFYDSGAVACPACHSTCLTCLSNTANSCLTCSRGNHRLITANNCPCAAGYFDSAAPLCAACHYSCVTCTAASSASCSSCSSAAHRTLTSDSCPCDTGFFDGGSAGCPACHYSCRTCSAGSTSSCLSCPSSSHRSLAAGTCGCAALHFDSGGAVCSPCHFSCRTCSGTTDSDCLSCDPGQHRTLAASQCLCDALFYEDSIPVCAPVGSCSYSCFTCDPAAPFRCLSCSLVLHRVVSGSTCPCEAGFFNSGSPSCQACHISCQSCTASADSSCLACDGALNRGLSGSSCPCSQGYFQSNRPTCSPCPSSCLSCSSLALCTDCPPAANREGPACACSPGFYDPGALTCQACAPLCATCSAAATQCASCAATRQLSLGSCPCALGYYDAGSVACAQCHYTCETCSGPGSAECLACSANYHRTLTAAFTCICETGFYLDLSYCFSCSFNCLTCAAASTICLACHPGSTLAATTCDCDAGLYRASDQSCRACPAKCETCSSASTCTACPAGSRRAIGDNCDCAAGYYAGGAECQACAPRCQRCWGAASFCTGCDAAALLTLVNGQCLCQQNYLPDSSGACQAGNPCTSASSSGACQACIQGYVLLQGQCLLVCPSGFFSSSSECSRCPDNCSVCSSAAACVACNPGLKIYRETCFTACPVGSYDSLGECLACHSSCSSCSEGLSCRACRPSAFLSGALCAACHSSCQECRGPSFTECTLCGPALTLQSNRCVSTSCSPTQYFSSVQFACTGCPAGCTGCQQELVRALLRLQCQACDVGYFADNLLCTSCDLKSGFSAGNLSQPPGQCWEVCGDGLRFVLACDDGNTIAGDGCDPFCHVEEGFTCSGGSPSSRDVCYPSEEIKMSLYTLKKTQFKNELAMEVQLQNYPMTITSETILPYLGLKINNVSDYRMRNVRFNAETGMLSMEVDYNETITDLFAELSLNTPEAYRAGVSYLPAVKALTVNFQIETAVAADYMPEAMSSTIRLLGEICFYLALALCGLALLALLFGWLEGVELLGYAQLTFLSTQVTNHLPELFSHPAQQLIVSFLHYDNLHVLDFIGLHTDESFSEFTIFNFRIEYAINGGWVLLCLILLLIIVVVVRFFKLCNDSTSSAQPAIGYLSRFILPKFAAVLTIPVLYFSSVFLFNSLYKPSTALTVNLVLSLSSILAIIGFFLSFAYQLNLSSVAHIHKLSQQFVSRREESCPSSKAELAPPAEEEPSEFHPKEQLVEGDLKSSLGSQFYLTFLWTSFISSAVAVSFTADFPAVRVSLLLFSRLVFSLYLVFFRPYKAMLSNLRLLLSQLLISTLFSITAINIFRTSNQDSLTWAMLGLAAAVLLANLLGLLVKAVRAVARLCFSREARVKHQERVVKESADLAMIEVIKAVQVQKSKYQIKKGRRDARALEVVQLNQSLEGLDQTDINPKESRRKLI